MGRQATRHFSSPVDNDKICLFSNFVSTLYFGVVLLIIDSHDFYRTLDSLDYVILGSWN